MERDVDTFLTAVSCVCDAVYQREIAPTLGPRRGARPKLSDSEVPAPTVLGQWHGHRRERCFARYARRTEGRTSSPLSGRGGVRARPPLGQPFAMRSVSAMASVGWGW